VYNMVPKPGQVSDFAFNVPLVGRVDIVGGIRSTSDDGLYFTISVPSSAQLLSSTLILWGVPSDPGHKSQLGWACSGALIDSCILPSSGTPDPSHATGKPFLSNPSGCVPAGQVTTLT
jgi:hypothetical protein